MSARHTAAFERIEQEHADVVAMLRLYAKADRRGLPGRPSFDSERAEVAADTAADAYALLLIATAEGFMRDYLDSISVPVGSRPELSSLIDRCRKEFNIRNPLIKIRAIDAEAVHALRRNRNVYAHGRGTSVFPAVPRVAAILAKFFDKIP